MTRDPRRLAPRSFLPAALVFTAAGLFGLAFVVPSPPSVFAQEDAQEQAEEESAPEVTLDRNGGDKTNAAEDGAAEEGAAEDEARESDGSAEDVMEDLLRRRQRPPATQPQRDPQRTQVPESVGVPAVTVEIDPDVLGIAPGQKAPELRREGEFIVSRRGRLVRSEDGAHVLFVFEADARDAPERPMIMMPCRMLESMEEIVADRGSDVEFILSGEVFVYRKNNYLLPTMMKIAIDRGNLEN
ncbi:MAG: hypothetical protein ACOC1G_01845 [Phycisphaeraceae bacterium]